MILRALAVTALFCVGARAQELVPKMVENRWGYADAKGELRIPAEFYWVDLFSEGLAYVQGKDKRSGYIDLTGKLVIRSTFATANPFRQGLAGVQLEICGKWSIIDPAGRQIIPPRYEQVGLFAEGLAAVRSKFKWGYVNRNGDLVIPCKFNSASDFKEGRATVSFQRKRGSIDREGVFTPIEPETPASTPEAPPANPETPDAPAAKIEGPPLRPARKVTAWGNPYRDRYPDKGKHIFSRNIRDMISYRGRIYVGAGDYWINTGPVQIFSFAPTSKKYRKEYMAPDEMVASFYIFENRLIAPSNDPRESWAFGNLYMKHKGRWKKHRTIPHGLHCFTLAYAEKRLYAIVSTEIGGKLLESPNLGKTWTEIRVHRLPRVIFPFDGSLCGLDNWDTFYRLEEGHLLPQPMLPRAKELEMPERRRGSPPHRYGRALAFLDGILLLPGFGSVNQEYAQKGMRFLAAGTQEPQDVPSFPGQWICDAVIRKDRLFLLCTMPKEQGYVSRIYETKDLSSWRCAASFESASFARSFEEARGDFFVSLGCNHVRGASPLPTVTGDILKVRPAFHAR